MYLYIVLRYAVSNTSDYWLVAIAQVFNFRKSNERALVYRAPALIIVSKTKVK